MTYLSIRSYDVGLILLTETLCIELIDLALLRYVNWRWVLYDYVIALEVLDSRKARRLDYLLIFLYDAVVSLFCSVTERFTARIPG